MRLRSVQLAPPFVVMSRNPPAAPMAMCFRSGSAGLTPRLYGLERNTREPFVGKPGEIVTPGETLAAAIRVHARPPLMVFQTRVLEKWKNTRPVASRLAGAGTIAVKNPKPKSESPLVAAAQF